MVGGSQCRHFMPVDCVVEVEVFDLQMRLSFHGKSYLDAHGRAGACRARLLRNLLIKSLRLLFDSDGRCDGFVVVLPGVHVQLGWPFGDVMPVLRSRPIRRLVGPELPQLQECGKRATLLHLHLLTPNSADALQ